MRIIFLTPNSVIKGFVDDDGIKLIDCPMNNLKYAPKDPVIKMFKTEICKHLYYLFPPTRQVTNILKMLLQSIKTVCMH